MVLHGKSVCRKWMAGGWAKSIGINIYYSVRISIRFGIRTGFSWPHYHKFNEIAALVVAVCATLQADETPVLHFCSVRAFLYRRFGLVMG